MHLYLRDPDGTVRVAKDDREWILCVRDERSKLARNELPNKTYISTVFSGMPNTFIDGEARPFETLLKAPDGDEYVFYLPDEQTAREIHRELVTHFKEHDSMFDYYGDAENHMFYP